MKLYVKALLITLACGLGLAGLFWKWSQNTSLQAPERIVQIDRMETEGLPNFLVVDLDGKKIQLADFQGQAVIVSFWASWCGPCLEEFPSLIELIEKMNGKVQLLAVSEDSSREEILAFLKSFPRSKNPSIHILWDESHEAGRLYNADRLPESFVAGKDHRLVRKIVGSIQWSTEDALSFMKEISEK